MQQAMDEHAGVLRSAASLTEADAVLSGTPRDGRPVTEDWETANLHAVSSVIVAHAAIREETRGSHWREDFPERDDARWRVRLVTTLDADGRLRTVERPVGSTGSEGVR